MTFSDLLATANISFQDEDVAFTPFETMAANTSCEIIRDCRSDKVWYVDFGSGEWEYAPVRPSNMDEVNQVLAQFKQEISA